MLKLATVTIAAKASRREVITQLGFIVGTSVGLVSKIGHAMCEGTLALVIGVPSSQKGSSQLHSSIDTSNYQSVVYLCLVLYGEVRRSLA